MLAPFRSVEISPAAAQSLLLLMTAVLTLAVILAATSLSCGDQLTEEIRAVRSWYSSVPVNVSNPGDGEFARQWWYYQSAEDQALIDSGELDYPQNLQPENFVDSFVLVITAD